MPNKQLIQALSAQVPIVDNEGRPTAQFCQVLQKLAVTDAFTKTDGGALDFADGGITLAKIQDIATKMIIARKTAGSGSPEECSISDILDFVGTTRGSILYRGATGWSILAPGTSGNALKTNGAGADPAWGTVSAAVAWGAITGTLSSQTDLQTALNAKAGTALFTATVNGLTPLSGGGTTNFLRADGSWTAPVGTTYAVFTSTVNGLAPLSGGGTTNFLRADGTWSAPAGTTYAVFTSTVNGLAPLSGGGTTNFLRADGTWAPAGSTAVFTSSVNGLAPASGGGTSNFLRADGSWTVPSGTATNSIFPINAPPFGSFTWVNQGTSTLTTNSDGSITLIPQDLGSDQVRAAVIAIPTTPWTRTIGFLPTIPSTGFGFGGVVLRESSSGKLVLLGCYRDSSAAALWISMNYNSATSKNANVLVPATPSNWTHSGPIYLTVSDDGTTRKCSIGTDPHYKPYLNYSVAHNSFIVPDQIGIFFDANGNVGGGITCFSWQ